MATEAEELQTKEFLKRAEIRTMKKDLQALRETDALKERDKIVKIKTLEEQEAEQKKKLAEKEEKLAQSEKADRESVLQRSAVEERAAEKNLKEYATEQERQQIFLLESERVKLESQVIIIDQEKDPTLKLEKNKILLEKRDWEKKLNSILEEEKKLTDEQRFISDKEQVSAIPSEKKNLEKRKWELDDSIQETEKKRWEVEKQLEEIENRIKELDKGSETLVTEKNSLQNKVLGIDKSLRDIYSQVIARVEEKRRGQAKEQKIAGQAVSKARAEQREQVQRQQWTHSADSKNPFENISESAKEKFAKSVEAEEESRKKFMQNVKNWAEEKEKT